MTTKTIQIPEDVVDAIQYQDAKRQAINNIVAKLIDSHSMDNDDSFMNSPVFRNYSNMAAEEMMKFDKLKNDMVMKYIPKDEFETAKKWTLDYGTHNLVLKFCGL